MMSAINFMASTGQCNRSTEMPSVKLFFLVLFGGIFVENSEGLFGSLLPEKVIVIDRFLGICPEYKTLPIVYKEMKLAPNDEGQLMLNITIVVHEDVPGPLKMEMKIDRCEARNKNNCEQLHMFRSRRYCDMIVSENDYTWRQFFQAIKPKWQCPLKKGTYKAVNAAFDVTTFLLMANENFYWKVRSETFDTNTGKTVLCIAGEGHIEAPAKK